MKLKKTTIKPASVDKPAAAGGASEPAPGGAAIANRFKLDLDPEAGKKGPESVGRKAAMFAMIGSLLALLMLGVISFMLYTNWEYAKSL